MTYSPPLTALAVTATLCTFAGDARGDFSGFAPPELLLPSIEAYNLTAGDLNGDGIDDLVVNDYGGSAVLIMLGEGDGAFSSPTSIALEGALWHPMIADLTGNGHADIFTTYALGTPGESALFPGNGDGTFGSPIVHDFGIGAAAAADLNNDGNLDLVQPIGMTEIGVRLGNGDGSFAAVQLYTAGTLPREPKVADLNGNGFLDLVVVNRWSDTLMVLLNQGDGTFGPPQSYTVDNGALWLTLGDFNGSGHIDIVQISEDYSDHEAVASVSILLGNGDGTFNQPQSFYNPTDIPMNGIESADFDGNGTLDLVILYTKEHRFTVHLGNGNGSFGPPLSFASGGLFPMQMVVADFNGHGQSDIAVLHGDPDPDGNGGLLAVHTAMSDQHPNFGDLNGDGIVDVSDLLILLANWGPCPRDNECLGDINNDDVVDVSDLLLLLANWSDAPTA